MELFFFMRWRILSVTYLTISKRGKIFWKCVFTSNLRLFVPTTFTGNGFLFDKYVMSCVLVVLKNKYSFQEKGFLFYPVLNKIAMHL